MQKSVLNRNHTDKNPSWGLRKQGISNKKSTKKTFQSSRQDKGQILQRNILAFFLYQELENL